MFFKRILLVLCLSFVGSVHAFMPQSGTWAITSELDGNPGRGMALDAQNGLLVISVYAYEKTGHPTFYLAAGNVTDNRFSASLARYEGGRFFGSGRRSGVETASPGVVNMRFTSGITGFVQFPGEPELAISRFGFGYPFEASSLQGLWSLTLIGNSGVIGGAVELSRPAPGTANGNGILASSNGLVGCEHQVRGSLAGSVLCAELNSSGQLVRGYVFVYSVNEGEGVAVNSAGTSQGALYVRRLTTPRGVGTGIAFKFADEEQALNVLLRENISLLAAQVAPQ